jgi:hypothetical protein
MGNRAVISLGKNYDDSNIGIYLHWNGGKASVEGFLHATRVILSGRLGCESYGTARLIETICSFFENGPDSIGVNQCKLLDTDNYDNGTYTVDPATMKITGRLFDGSENTETNREKSLTIAHQLIAKKLENVEQGAFYDSYRAELQKELEYISKELESL